MSNRTEGYYWVKVSRKFHSGGAPTPTWVIRHWTPPVDDIDLEEEGYWQDGDSDILEINETRITAPDDIKKFPGGKIYFGGTDKPLKQTDTKYMVYDVNLYPFQIPEDLKEKWADFLATMDDRDPDQQQKKTFTNTVLGKPYTGPSAEEQARIKSLIREKKYPPKPFRGPTKKRP